MSTALRRRVAHLEARAATEAAFPSVSARPLQAPADVVGLLAEQAEAVRQDPHADPLDRARTLALIGGLALRAMDAADGRARLEALERHGYAAGAGGDPDPFGSGGERLDGPQADAADAAGRSAGLLPALCGEAEVAAIRELAVVWTALGRFAADRVGVTADALLGARGLGRVAREAAAALGRHPGVRPDPAAVAEYAGLVGAAWAERFGEDE